MVGSSKNLSIQDQTVHSSLLAIKQNQIPVIDLDSCTYDAFMLPIVECLNYSPLTIALTQMENFPLSLLSKAHSSAKYIMEEQRIIFEIHNHTTSITKNRFLTLFGLHNPTTWSWNHHQCCSSWDVLPNGLQWNPNFYLDVQETQLASSLERPLHLAFQGFLWKSDRVRLC